MFRAYYESSHFDFEAYGKTENEARKALIAGLEAHAGQYDCAPGWWRADGWSDEDLIPVYRITLGVALRDRQALR